jgi:starch synthase
VLQVKNKKTKLNFVDIIHIAAELAPLAKVGGLGDVIHGLGRALITKGQSVTIILPKYRTLQLEYAKQLEVIEPAQIVFFDGKNYRNTIWQANVDGLTVLLIESHAEEDFFGREKIYGYEDDTLRFIYFCLSALELVQNLPCDVIHIHDWHTALIAGLVKEVYQEIHAITVFTIHNLAYQGLCKGEDLDKVGWKSPALKESGVYNLMKGGIHFADQVTTVSPNYAKEILTTELGGNLQATLQHHSHKFQGILNGIDFDYWNPETDTFLPFNFSSKRPENKKCIQANLRARFSLAEENCPIVGAITRLVPQKGPELIKASILRTLEWGGQFILLGSASDEKTYQQFYNLKRKLEGSRQVHIELTYNEALSHVLYAGSDLFLVPSLFEPCGLTQLIAMRYGTVPLVRQTGGLADTVFDGKNGFVFGPPTAEAINRALDRAFETWFEHPEKWQKLMEAGLKGDYSWHFPAEAYLRIYNRIDTAEIILS